MYWSYILTAGGILGIYLAGKKNMYGWALGLFMQWLWVIYAVQTKQYGFILSAIAYGAVYAMNFYRWRNDAPAKQKSRRIDYRGGTGYQPRHAIPPEQFNELFDDKKEPKNEH